MEGGSSQSCSAWQLLPMYSSPALYVRPLALAPVLSHSPTRLGTISTYETLLLSPSTSHDARKERYFLPRPL